MRRLSTSLSVSIAGSLVALLGSRATWVSSPTKSISITVPGFRPALIPEAGLRVSALDIGGEWIAVGAFFALVCAILALLAHPRLRSRMLALAALLSVVVLVFSLTTAAFAEDRARGKGLGEPDRRTGVIMLTLGGAFVALFGSVAAMLASQDAPSLRLPEKAPEAGEEGSGGANDRR